MSGQSAERTLRDQHPDWFIDRDGKAFVLYRGLLALAHDRGLVGITVTTVQLPSEMNGSTAVCSATVQMKDGTFSEIGDANPSNVTRMMVPHIIRMAATRAKARALRDAVNVGVTAFEELGGGSDDGLAGAEEVQDAQRYGPVPKPFSAVLQSGASPTRRPSVAVQGAQKVDQDAGRAGPNWPQNGGPVPDVDTLSRLAATDRQREALHKFGHRDLPADLTRKQASDMLSDAIAKKGGA